MTARCACGRPIRPVGPRGGRPRRWCDVCSPPRASQAGQVVCLAPVGTVPEAGAPREELGLLEECRRVLEGASRLDSVAGQVVLVLAGRLVAGGHSASGVAALSRELRAAMGEALRDAPGKDDRLGRLARKWTGAGK